MARRKRKEDAPDWVAPDFDEVGYMRKEIEGARAAVATIAWAVIGALVAFGLYSVLPALAFFAGIAVGFGMFEVVQLIVGKEPSALVVVLSHVAVSDEQHLAFHEECDVCD